MKKQIAIFALLAAAVVGLKAPSWAFTSVGISTFPASVTTGGVKTSTFTAFIRNVNDPFGGNQANVSWSGVTPPSTAWKVADQLFVINSTVTDANGGVQIYTRNTDPDASPQFVDPTPGDSSNPDSNPAGLLRGTSGTTGATLAMAWSIKSSTKVVELNDAGRGIGAADPTVAGSGFNNGNQWLFMQDQATPNIPSRNTNAFVDGASFVTIINSDGIHVGQGDTEFDNHADGLNAYLYLQALFTGAIAQQDYQTTTLLIEAYLE